HVSLPIFDETNNELLEKGATVLQGTSFPIGGKGTHSVITGHTGLPEKKLFTDLEKLKKGDLFYIEVSGKKLAYRVERFKTVLPTELDSLKIEDSSDLVTLLTCTPYMINTHRLLVTGVRVGFETKK
ncbi:MAG: class C sortase, partial [Pseudolactococcus laudensis]